MKILTVDIGTGTQDIFLYDSRLDIENGFKLVVPSPTMMVRRRIQDATRRGQPVLLTGVIMGGGPSAWAAEDHIKAGLPLYARPEAARTFNDDLEAVRQMGVWIVSEDEVARLPDDVLRLELRDFDFPAISSALEIFGVSLDDLDRGCLHFRRCRATGGGRSSSVHPGGGTLLPPAASPRSGYAGRRNPRGRPMRILLVEDEPDAARMLAKGLRAEAHAVDVVNDGEAACYQAAVADYDAVVLDVRLPVKDGFAVCREMRERGSTVPILMLTARDGVEDRIAGLDSGADDYLPKPFDFGELLARLRALLRRGARPLLPERLRV